MTKQFTPTKEQLEKLAKVAGFKIINIDGVLYLVSNSLLEEDWELWQPENNRDQIADVIERLSEEQKDKYYEKLYYYWSNTQETTENIMEFGQTVPAHVSCEKLCEVVGDG